jgi:hypothetical protein
MKQKVKHIFTKTFFTNPLTTTSHFAILNIKFSAERRKDNNMILFYTQFGTIINATDFNDIYADKQDGKPCIILDKCILGYYNESEIGEIIKWIFKELSKTRKAHENVGIIMPKEEIIDGEVTELN